jgi:phage shock protein PspC (stress-responsive transcriptional regulator)
MVSPPMPGRPLMRPIVGRQVAGVCLALARSNGWDVGLIRILTVIGFIFSGGFVGIAYLAGWIGIPEEPMPFPGTNPPSL